MDEISNEMDFQQAFDSLKETVDKLEDPKTTIDESIELYEQACKLVVFCQRKLNDNKLKITDINERIAQLRQDSEPLLED